MAKFNLNNSSDDGCGSTDRVRLRVLGISYSQIQSGAYALILAQTDGPYRIPVVVGSSEAQSIAIKMEGIVPPRPMTHDLFASLLMGFNLVLEDVFIYKFEDGVFSSELTISDADGKRVKIDARTSDAIAIAMRTQTPIFTTAAILEETGFIMEIQETDSASAEPQPHSSSRQEDAENYSLEELNERLMRHIEKEEYEEAARIKAIIARRKKD